MKISRTLRSIFVFLVVIATAVLSWIGFAKLYPNGNQPAVLQERIFRVIKALLGDPIGNALEDKNLPWELALAKFLAVLILIGGVYKVVQSVFTTQLTLLRVLFKRRHKIVVGINNKGSQILENLKNCQKENAVAIELINEHENTQNIRDKGHLVIFGDAADKDVLKEAGIKRAKDFICFFDDEQKSLEIVNAVNEIYDEAKPNNELDCFIHLDNPRLIESLQNSELLQKEHKNGVNIRMFNTFEMIARNFFNQFPLHYQNEIQAGKKFRLVFFGFNATSTALILQALRILHFPEPGLLEIVICGENIDRKSRIFFEKYPKIQKIAPFIFREFNGTFREVVDEFCLNQDSNTEPVIISCFDDDKQNLNFSLEIMNATAGENFKIFTLNTNASGMNKLFRKDENQRIKFFGNLDYVCKIELITGETQDKLAKAIHNDYLEIQQELAATESAAYKTSWDELSENAKSANRTQADHIIYKLILAGKPLNDFKNLQFSAEETEELAIAEHRRWEAHRLVSGWDFGENRDDLKKLHPSIIPWAKLPEPEKQKDRDTILRQPKILKNINSLEF